MFTNYIISVPFSKIEFFVTNCKNWFNYRKNVLYLSGEVEGFIYKQKWDFFNLVFIG